MNYQQLLNQLQLLTPEQLQQTVTVYLQNEDEYFAIDSTDTTLEDDVLDEGSFILVLISYVTDSCCCMACTS